MSERTRILLVDDDPSVITLLTRALGNWGYEVSSAASAEAALDRMVGPAFDLLIVDKCLPGMSGADLMARAQSHWPNIRTLLITADLDLDLDFPVKPTRALLKPFPNLDEVKTAVKQALEA